jgi:hypothetical protein
MSNDTALMVEWGMPTPGRENRALEEFFAHVQWWSELKAKGTIAEFRIYGTNTGDLGSSAGFVIVEGTKAQIEAFAGSDDFRKSLSKVSLITQHVCVRTLDTGDAMTKRMQIYGSALKELKF